MTPKAYIPPFSYVAPTLSSQYCNQGYISKLKPRPCCNPSAQYYLLPQSTFDKELMLSRRLSDVHLLVPGTLLSTISLANESSSSSLMLSEGGGSSPTKNACANGLARRTNLPDYSHDRLCNILLAQAACYIQGTLLQNNSYCPLHDL